MRIHYVVVSPFGAATALPQGVRQVWGMERKSTIYFADLTHKGLVLSSNVFPLSIGLIAAYLQEQRPGQAEVQLFKYPDDFSRALEARQPDIVGFANYS